jgi:hypothetical protein
VETRTKLAAANRGRLARENSPHWKGGRKTHGDGYIQLHQPDHPASNVQGYIYEHRLIMEQRLGRLLLPKEVVHHIDGDATNNAPDNLMLFASNTEHRGFHKEERIRALAGGAHPDKGGSDERMKELNDALERIDGERKGAG